MHVACRCGEPFTVSADRLPLNIRCPVCDRLFKVSHDGSTAEAHEVQPVAVQTACQCGQPFTVHAEQFPRHIHCHACGRHFNVLDDGQIVEADNGIRTETTARPSTAIQPESTLPSANPRAVIAEDRIDHFNTGSEEPTEEGKRRAEVKLIDYMWKLEREQYSLIPFFGIEIMPSKQGAFVAGVAIILVWCALVTVAASIDRPGWLCLGLLIFAISIGFPVNIYRRAHEYEKAEAAWQGKRAAAIAKCESLTEEN